LAAKDAARGQYVATTTVEMIADACLIGQRGFGTIVMEAMAEYSVDGRRLV
jgi:hypothetical protein